MMKALPPNKKKNGFAYLLVVALAITAFILIANPNQSDVQKISLNKFVEEVKAGLVHQVTITDNAINIELTDGTKQTTNKEPGADIYSILEKTGVKEDSIASLQMTVEDTASNKFWKDLLIGFIPFMLIIGFFFFMMRSAQNANNQAMGFGKSQARVMDKANQKTTFDDVAGVLEAKNELEEVVDFLKYPQKYTSMGAKIPKGVLLVGPPGTGKLS